MQAAVNQEGPGRFFRLSAFAIIIIAFVLRLFRLDYQSIWWDEAYSIDISSLGLAELTAATAADIHPPLYYYLLHFWIDLTGQSEFSTRFFSLILGLLLVALVYRVARCLLGEPEAILAVLLAGLSTFLVSYSQEVRAYTMETLLCLVFAYLAFILLQRARGSEDPEPRIRSRYLWAGYVLVSALSLYTDYFPAFVIVFINAVVFLWIAWAWLSGTRPWGFIWRWVAAQTLVIALFLPWLGIGFGQVAGYGEGNVTAPSLPDQIIQIWYGFIMGRIGQPGADTGFIAVMAMLLLGGSILAFRLRGASRGSTFGRVFLLAYLFGSVAAFLVILVWRPYFHPRYIAVASPPVFILLGMAIVGWWRLRRPFGMAAGMLAVTVMAISLQGHYFDPAYAKDDVQEMISFLEEEAGPDDLILWMTAHPFKYYYAGVTEAVVLEPDFERTPDELTRLSRGKQRVFWVTWKWSMLDTWEMVPFLLGSNGAKLGERSLSNYRARWYKVPPSPAYSLGRLDPTSFNFEDTIALTDVALQDADNHRAVPSGEVARVSMKWKALSKPENDLKFYVVLRDDKGHEAGQFDRLFYSRGGGTTRFWKGSETTYGFATPRVLPGVPPGEYLVEVGVYEQETDRRLAVVEGVVPTIVGTITVERPAAWPLPDELAIPHRMERQFDGVELVGFDIDSGDSESTSAVVVEVAQGDVLPLTLLWRSTGGLDLDPQPEFRLRLTADGGNHFGSEASPLGGERYPYANWESGEVVRQWIDYRLPPDIPPDKYRLELTLDSAPPLPLAEVVVKSRDRLFEAPPMTHETNVEFGEGITLLGFDVGENETDAARQDDYVASIGPGQAVALTLYWRADSIVTSDYTVFTHLLDPSNRVWGQKDATPVDGASPTTSWLPGQVIADSYLIPLAEDAPDGDYVLEVGLYRPVSGARLPLVDGGDRVVLGLVRVAR